MTGAHADEVWMPVRVPRGTPIGAMMGALSRFLDLFDGDQPTDPSIDHYTED
jgi:hypothetical protein